MIYSNLGHTNIKVSKICLGTMTYGEQNTEKEAHEQLNFALESGVNFVDTAEMYPVPPKQKTQGLTEKYIGSWLKKYKKRQEVILATKITGPGSDFSYIRNPLKIDKKNISVSSSVEIKNENNEVIGDLRSACYSPHFKKVIGIAMIKEPNCKTSTKGTIKIDDKSYSVSVCELPFI